MLSPKNQVADLLTNGSFTRDDWCYLLCLVNRFGIFYVFSQPFSFSGKGDQHDEENSRKEGRRTCGGKAEVSVFDFNKLEQRASLLISVPMFPMSRGVRCWIQGLSKEPLETAGRTLSKTESKTQKRILKCWKGTTSLTGGCGELKHCAHDHVTRERGCGKLQRDNAQSAMPDTAQGAAGKCVQGCPRQHAQEFKGLQETAMKDWNPTTDDQGWLRQSSRIFVENGMKRRMMRCLTWRPTYWSGDQLCRLQWNRQFVLAWNMIKIWLHARNTNVGGTKTLFEISLSLIAENSFEILNLCTMMYDVSPWMRMTLCHDQAMRWANAKVHVYSDSVLRLGRTSQLSEVRRIVWTEFEWNIFPGFTKIGIHTYSERSERSTKKCRSVWGKNYIHIDIQRHDWTKKEILMYVSRMPEK